jgi:hypothetical protein
MKFEEFSDAAVAVLVCLGRVTKMTQFINLSHSNEIFGHNFFSVSELVSFSVFCRIGGEG